MSARVLERQIRRLLGSAYAEVRVVGAELKAACQQLAEPPLLAGSHAGSPSAPRGADGIPTDPAVAMGALAEPQPPAAPTLVKYAEASADAA